MLRHSYITHKYGKVHKDREEDAKRMGHTLRTQSDYIRE